MKVRAFLLIACLLVLPLLAMFSHKIPRGVRESLQKNLWQPACGTVLAWVGVEHGDSAAAVSVPTAEPVVAAVARIPADEVRTDPSDVPSSEMVARPAAPSAESLPTVAIQSSPVPSVVPSAQDVMRKRLQEFGAVNIQVKTADTVGVVHVASCRLPVDADGQLQRFFQANGSTSEESMRLLLEQVSGWKARLATLPGAPAAPAPASRFQ